MSKTKDQLRTKLLIIRVSEQEFDKLQTIKKGNKISIARIFRDTIPFLEAYYKTKTFNYGTDFNN